ncbi:hypothetical protein BGZ65_012468 [Modicella reniformis]|uniref:BTB domain-containing protein n=1 Tax=Modicella reniformis TaxID=1440133 RepID=A0A9P6MJE9_9FUNG|nr:hypothetical protein BGZ65_012468 [Modicella reniformis]
MPEFKYIHCIPQNATNEADVSLYRISDRTRVSSTEKPLVKGGECTFSIIEESIVDEDDPNMYAFNLVLSTSDRLPSNLAVKWGLTLNKSLKDMFPDVYEGMLRLLCDPGSANTAFVFTIHSSQRRGALLAHRTLLDRHPRFHELFEAFHQRFDERNGFANNRMALISIEGISLTTFCILLKYIYTKDLDLVVDPTQFLICDMDHLQREASKDFSLAVLNKTLWGYNAALFYATWNDKDGVTWSDLFLAADRFEIAELRKQCLKNLLASVDESNAMDILFGVGTQFKEEIGEPVMIYISEHLDDVFSLQTQDPFKRFENREGCHENTTLSIQKDE